MRERAVTIGRIERLRRRAGLSLTEVARRSGITRKTLRAIEQGHRATPETATRLARVLGSEAFDAAVRPLPKACPPALKVRHRLGISRAEAARRIGVSYGILRAAENGQVTDANARLIAAFYGIDVAAVRGDTPERRAA